MAHRTEALIYLRCAKASCSIALPTPREPVGVECPYHPGAAMHIVTPKEPEKKK